MERELREWHQAPNLGTNNIIRIIISLKIHKME
jgi:hypothetical protein